MKRNKPITTLVHKHKQQTIKVKHKIKGREMQTQDNTKTCYQRGNQRTQQKTSLRPSKLKLIHQRIKLEYTNNKKLSKPSLPNVLEPSKLLLPTDFSQSCLLQLFESRNMPNCIHQVSSASFGKSSKLPKLENTLYTLKMCGLCLGTNLLSRYDNGRGKEKRLQ